MTVATAESSSSPSRLVRRAHASRTPKWQRFQPRMIEPTERAASVEATEKGLYAYQRQYSHVYSHRLVALKDRCWAALAAAAAAAAAAPTRTAGAGAGEGGGGGEEEEGVATRVNRVLELQEDRLSQVVGTLVKETTDPTEETLVHPPAATTCRPSDQLFLEDESGRVALTCGDDVHGYCTGVVVGVQGTVDLKGNLHVQRMVPPAPLVPSPLADAKASAVAGEGDPPTTPSQPAGLAPRLLLVSSLLCGDAAVSSLPREMLVGYLQGQFTDDAAGVCRVVVAGSGPSATDPLGGLRELDLWAAQVGGAGAAVPVDLMPSANDPTTRNWPQRPLHSSLLPRGCGGGGGGGRRPMLTLVPNPYEAVHGDGRVVLGTDGLNVRDLQRHVVAPRGGGPDGPQLYRRLTELEALERTLEWSHLCPTGPDSLGMVPLDDPMVMSTDGGGGGAPHIYFCGNCEEGFATKISAVNGTTRLVCVPKFSETGEAVLVNLETLEAELLRFREGEEEGDDDDDDADGGT